MPKLECSFIISFILQLSVFKQIGKQSNNAFIIFSCSLPMSNRMRKKMQKKTSYQKTKEEFETVREQRKKKKEVKCFCFIVND